MILLIDFECPECRKSQPQQISDLTLGKRESCICCGAETELSEKGLEELHQRLREIFRE